MTGCPCVCICRWLVVSALSTFCLWRSFDAASAYFDADDAYAYSASWRSAARLAPKGNIALLGTGADRIAPIDRSRLIAISWERAPDPLSLVDENGDFGRVDCVFSSAWHSSSARRKLESKGFAVVASNEYVKTWARKGAVGTESSADVPGVSTTRELIALLLELSLLIAVAVFATGCRRGLLRSSVASILVMTALGCVAMSHPLLEPNGLGVYGGKAKLWFLCGGMPSWFMASSGGAVLQPAYPPGVTVLAYLHFVVSGGCGDRLVQLLPVFATGLLCFLLLRDVRHRLMALPVVLFCLSPLTIRLTSGFYAEPFVALLLVTGWGLMREGRVRTASFVMGTAGMFRPEAGIVAACFAFSGGWFRGGVRPACSSAAFASVPMLAWLAACAVFGFGTVPDWNFLAPPKTELVVLAAGELLKSLTELAIPALAVAHLVLPVPFGFRVSDGARRFCRGFMSAVIPAVLLLLAIPFVCGFHDSSYSEWMIGNTVPRLVWYLLAIPSAVLFGFVRRF